MRRPRGVWLLLGMLCALSGLTGCQAGGSRPLPAAAPTVQADLPDWLPRKFTPQSSLYPMIADKEHRLVHRRDCPRVAAVPEVQKRFFRGYGPAQAAGFKACPDCRPDRP